MRSSLDPEIVFQRELSAAALGAERGNFSILYPRRFSTQCFSWDYRWQIQMHIQAPPVSSVRMQPNSFHRQAPTIRAVAITSAITILPYTPDIPATNRQSFYGSFTRDICDKYLTVFADFKYTRSFFDAAFSATPFVRDAFKGPNGFEFSPCGISVPIQNPFNPFTVADATLIYNGVPVPVTTGVSLSRD